MSENNKAFELTEDELEKVSGGRATAMGWSSYQGTCVCDGTFEVNNKRTENKVFICTCTRKYELIGCNVYCNGNILSSTSYTITDHDE